LSELLTEEVFVTSFNTSTMKHHLWSKQQAIANKKFDINVWEAALATSAAPTFFPAMRIDGEEHVDGGVCMNNPTLALVTRALKLGKKKKDLFCVSIGTGSFVKPLAPTVHFGRAHWAQYIFEATSSGIYSQTLDYLKTLLPKI